MPWNPVITHVQISQHQDSLFEIYQENLAIRGKPLLVDDPLVYVKLISPEQDNYKAIGLNVFSSPSRKQTLKDAMENDHPKATPIIQLVQSNIKEPAFLLFYPVLEQVASDYNESIKRLQGFATGIFLAEKLVENAISTQQQLFSYQFFQQGKKQALITNNQSNNNLIKSDREQYTHAFDIGGQNH